MIKLLLLIFIMSSSFAREPIVIANQDVPEIKIPQFNLVNIFTRKQIFWSNGHKITVYTKPVDSIEHKIFTINVLNLTPFKYKTLLDSISYTGKNTPTIELKSDQEMIFKLSMTPFAIGYINNDLLFNDSQRLIHITSDD